MSRLEGIFFYEMLGKMWGPGLELRMFNFPELMNNLKDETEHMFLYSGISRQGAKQIGRWNVWYEIAYFRICLAGGGSRHGDGPKDGNQKLPDNQIEWAFFSRFPATHKDNNQQKVNFSAFCLVSSCPR